MPTLIPAMSTAIATVADETVTRILIPIPKRCLDWLEREALRRKQEQGQSRMAKAPIIVELIEEAMQRTVPAKRAGRKGGEKA